MRTSNEAATAGPSTREALWRERAGAWRKSGESADKYSEGRGFAAGTLRWWSSRLGRQEAPQVVRLVPRSSAMPTASRDLVVEVGRARIRMSSLSASSSMLCKRPKLAVAMGLVTRSDSR